jgi:hypothetical protein
LADRDEQGQLLTLESEKLGSGDAAPVTKMAIDLNIVSSSVGPATQALSSASSAMKLAAFKIRTQRYLQVLFRMFSM